MDLQVSSYRFRYYVLHLAAEDLGSTRWRGDHKIQKGVAARAVCEKGHHSAPLDPDQTGVRIDRSSPVCVSYEALP